MKSVALTHSQDHMILMNEDQIYDVVEQYAAGGLEILAVEMKNQVNFPAYLVKFLHESLKKRNLV
jgi:hypothetical protein